MRASATSAAGVSKSDQGVDTLGDSCTRGEGYIRSGSWRERHRGRVHTVPSTSKPSRSAVCTVGGRGVDGSACLLLPLAEVMILFRALHSSLQLSMTVCGCSQGQGCEEVRRRGTRDVLGNKNKKEG